MKERENRVFQENIPLSNQLTQVIVALLSSYFCDDVGRYLRILALVQHLPLLFVFLILLFVACAEELGVIFRLVEDVELVWGD